MTFSFVLDAFPDYTKFDKTHKVLAAIQVIEDQFGDIDEQRGSCSSFDYTVITKDLEVSYDNDSTSDNVKMTVTGNNINGTYHNADWWGDVIPSEVGLAEFEIMFPVEEGKTYTMTTHSPLHKFYKDDPRIHGDDKTGYYKRITDVMDSATWTLRAAVTSLVGAIDFELREGDENGPVVKKVSVTNKVNFAKSYDVTIDGVDKISSLALNEETQSPVPASVRAIVGDEICIEPKEIDALVKANGNQVKKETDGTYIIPIKGVTKITVE